jgi:hypothetical protein
MDELGDFNEPALQHNKKGREKKILREPGRPTNYACVASGGPDRRPSPDSADSKCIRN